MWVHVFGAVVGGIVGGFVYLLVMRARPTGRDSEGRTVPAAWWSAVGMGLALFVILLGHELLLDRGWSFAAALVVALLCGIAVLGAVSALYTAVTSRPGRHRDRRHLD